MSYWHTGKLEIMCFLGKESFIQLSKMTVNRMITRPAVLSESLALSC